jgi:hypothetical protein
MSFAEQALSTNDHLVDPAAAALETPCLHDLLRHWRAVRGDRLMPGWSDIDPAQIKPLLPILWSWTYDRASDSFTGRIAGEEINTIFKKSLRHMPMAEFFKDWDYPTIFQRHKRVVDVPCIAIGSGLVFSHAGRQAFGERLILPLASDGVHADGIIGATVYEFGRLNLTEPGAPNRLSRDGENVRYFPL